MRPQKNKTNRYNYHRLLFLIPILLVGLSLVAPLSIYKDNVNFSYSGADSQTKPGEIDVTIDEAFKLAPSHWNLVGFSVQANKNSSAIYSRPQETNRPYHEPISKGATFWGFPFAAYFNKDIRQNGYTETASAYSWLWFIANTLLVISSLVFAIVINRKNKNRHSRS